LAGQPPLPGRAGPATRLAPIRTSACRRNVFLSGSLGDPDDRLSALT